MHVNIYGLFGEFMGLVFIVLVFGGSHIRRFLDILERKWTQPRQPKLTDEEMQHMERTQQLAGSGSIPKQIEALREELARLRDTSTQYDISIQHTLEELHQRVSTLESQRRYDTRPIAEEEPQKTVGLHR